MSHMPWKNILYKSWSHKLRGLFLPRRYLRLLSTVGSNPDRETHACGISHYSPSPPSWAITMRLLQRLLCIINGERPRFKHPGLNNFTSVEISRQINIVLLPPHVHINEDYCPEFTKTPHELSIRPTLDITLYCFHVSNSLLQKPW